MAEIPEQVWRRLKATAQRLQWDEATVRVVAEMLHQAAASGQTLVPEQADTFVFGEADAAPASPVSEPGRSAARYQDLGLLGRGGIGEVRRVYDPELRRTVALKLLHPQWEKQHQHRARFVDEARLTGQLSHPGVVAVHELSSLPDGRPCFTMKEIHGRTLAAVISEVHADAQADAWSPSSSGWSVRRLLRALGRACETVAYAHAQGIIHRDIKPQNIMVGAFGEVYVVDWGLAAQASAAAPPRPLGTPSYMAPEQAAARAGALQPPADVFALGCVLYEVLSGRPPIGADSTDVEDRLAQARDGRWAPLESLVAVPDPLRDICARAMAVDPARRYPDAGALARALADWQEGEQHRQRAQDLIAQADALAPQIDTLQAEADRLRAEARALQARVPGHAPISEKRLGWEREDAARDREARARAGEVDYVQLLHTALHHAPALPEAHARLADHYRRQHAAAEDAGDRIAASRAETLLRAHDRGAHGGWLAGQGRVTLITDPPGARAHLYRYAVIDRTLRPVPVRALGDTPVRDLTLPIGSYLVTLHAEGRPLVRYPLQIRREQEWSLTPPGQVDPAPIVLPETIEDGAVYVPAGWFVCGGDPDARLSFPRQAVWVDGFVMQRFPVTNEAYLRFLNALLRDGRREEAMRFVPRERAAILHEVGQPCYTLGPHGFGLTQDGEGDAWLPRYPVVNIDWSSASAYAAWYADQTGQPWRLPGELEWEKAARGTDGRFFPWGDHIDPTFCCILESHADRPLPSVVDDYPVDESPYGVRGLGGNVAEWCRDAWGRDALPDPRAPLQEAPLRALRGGWWVGPPRSARAALRNRDAPQFRDAILGFRLVRDLTPR